MRGVFKTFPARDDVDGIKILMNSCNFHGWAPFIKENGKAVTRRVQLAADAELVLHLGDQLYADKPWPAVTLEDFRGAYLRGWGDPGTLELLATRPNYMIPSDHEAINGYATDAVLDWVQKLLLALRGYPFWSNDRLVQTIGANAKRAYEEFQHSHAPKSPPRAYYYSFAVGSFQFFALDQRFERSINTGEMVSSRQLADFLDWLRTHRGKLRLVMTESPFITEMCRSDEKWRSDAFREQRDQVLNYLADEGAGKVLFLTGDVHASCHSVMRLRSSDGRETVINELVASPVNGTLMKSADQFLFHTSGETDLGTSYVSTIDSDTFVGASAPRSTLNSNVMKLTLTGSEVCYEIHRTRCDDEGPFRQGRFRY